MHLWTEYVGNTVAGYALSRLSRSEGRSAFFVTAAEGEPALLRLTELHFDDGELSGRWKRIAAVSHPGLQALRASGQTVFDDVPLAFCLLEPVDASLSDVLRERVLTTEEAAEVAVAIGGALAALHAAELVHGHVDAINVFAVGEAVKLRSDCARECTGDFEADTPEAREALRQRDVHDLGLLLRRCLTPQWEESSAMRLPSPFDQVVRRALNGTVHAAGVVAELKGLAPAREKSEAETTPVAGINPVRAVEAVTRSPVAAAVASRAAGTAERVVAGRSVGSAGRVSLGIGVDAVGASRRPGAVSAVAAIAQRKGVAPVRAGSEGNSPAAVAELVAARERGAMWPGEALETMRQQRAGEQATTRQSSAARDASAPEVSLPMRNTPRFEAGNGKREAALLGGLLQALGPATARLAQHKMWLVSGVAAVVLGLAMWGFGGSRHAPVQTDVPVADTRDAAKPQSAPETAVVQAPVAKSEASSATKALPSHAPVPPPTAAGWHVIAYTYRYEKQAEAKALQLKERYVGLQPQVYSPTGRAPFFVALGGPSDAVSAMALRNRARRAGLPRDTYARNF